MQETCSVDEAARRLGISRGTGFRLARAGHIAGVPVLRVGKKLRLPVRALDRVLYDSEKEGG